MCRKVHSTEQPRCPSASADAAPMPWFAPVTIAVCLPAQLAIALLPSYGAARAIRLVRSDSDHLGHDDVTEKVHNSDEASVRGWPAQCPGVPLHRQGHPKIVSNRFAEMIFGTHP